MTSEILFPVLTVAAFVLGALWGAWIVEAENKADDEADDLCSLADSLGDEA